jgi:hypothetical protein
MSDDFGNDNRIPDKEILERLIGNCLKHKDSIGAMMFVSGALIRFLPFFIRNPNDNAWSTLMWLSDLATRVMDTNDAEVAEVMKDPELARSMQEKLAEHLKPL